MARGIEGSKLEYEPSSDIQKFSNVQAESVKNSSKLVKLEEDSCRFMDNFSMDSDSPHNIEEIQYFSFNDEEESKGPSSVYSKVIQTTQQDETMNIRKFSKQQI